MRSAESLLSIAAKFRKLAEDVDEELGTQLRGLADEYERMAAQFAPENEPTIFR